MIIDFFLCVHFNKKKNDFKSMCDYCHLDEIKPHDIPKCMICSINELITDINNGNFSVNSFVMKDRIYYFILLIILIMIIRRMFFSNISTSHKNQQPNYPSWEEYCRWHS